MMCEKFQLVLCTLMSLAILAALSCPIKRDASSDDLSYVKNGNAAILSIIIQQKIQKDEIDESIEADIAALTWIKDTLKTKDSLNYATLLEILLADIGRTLDEETLLYLAKNTIQDLQVHVHITRNVNDFVW